MSFDDLLMNTIEKENSAALPTVSWIFLLFSYKYLIEW